MKKILITLFVGILITMSSLIHITYADNGLPYKTYTYSSSTKEFIGTQDAYIPLSLTKNIGDITLSKPVDMTIDKDDYMYIVDETIPYVIRYGLEDQSLLRIGEGLIQQPTGVHVDRFSNVYVTDKQGNVGYQFKFDLNYDINQAITYKRPENSPFFIEGDVFQPNKIVTDNGGLVYIVSAGNSNGVLRFSNDGEFSSFFGANSVPNTFENMMKRIFMTRDQRINLMKPNPVTNVAVDESGLIIKTTKGQRGFVKLDLAGNPYMTSVWGFAEVEDVFVGPHKTIFTVNGTTSATADSQGGSNAGIITEYAPDGTVLFIFGGRSLYSVKGMLHAPTSIAVDSKNNIYVLDQTLQGLQMYIPTEFANLVHHAVDLYQDGQYEKSLPYWQEVLKMNGLFDLANKGIGDAYFTLQQYDKAMEAYMIARDTQMYSEAFWEVRNEALLSSGPTIVIVLLVLVVLTIINSFVNFTKYLFYPIKRLHRYLMNFKVYREIIYGFYVLRHPEDGFYGIKREQKSSNLTASILFILFFIAYMTWMYQTNFLFNNVIASEINFLQQVIAVFLPLALWVISNYLVSSIRDGEGKLSDVYQATAYILIPMIITLPLLTLISQVLTNQEAFIYDAIMFIGLFLSFVYLIFMVKEVHFYEMRSTIANILITIFTAIMILLFVLIIYLLLGEAFGFISDILREVNSRG